MSHRPFPTGSRSDRFPPSAEVRRVRLRADGLMSTFWQLGDFPLSTHCGRARRRPWSCFDAISCKMTPIITINGTSWRTANDAIDGLLQALRPLDGHGRNINAFIDSMMYGGMLEIEPPYEIVVQNVGGPDAALFIDDLSAALLKAGAGPRAAYREEFDVSVRREL